jgi:tRNA A-37 threonylcarbamoyl transferase component Bud32
MPAELCAQCGAEIPAALAGACPRCLLDLGALTASQPPTLSGPASEPGPPRAVPFDFGGYRVTRLLGRGGMGEVYEASEVATGRRVAVKMLHRHLANAETRRRFLREGRLAAGVNHPNNVYIFGTEEIETTPVIVMELLEAGTLKDEVARHGPMRIGTAVDAILQVIAVLEASAATGVLHRDVKPANCFVAPDGTVKVGDFGLSISTVARTDEERTSTGLVLGTLAYAAPEQLRGEDLDVRADLYSVGATLYTLLTAHAPFARENDVQLIAAVLESAPTPLREYRRDLPRGLVAVLERCLAKKRDDRYASYAELRAALRPFSSAAPTPAPLGRRFLAGFVDDMIAWIPARVVEMFFFGDLVGHLLAQRTFAAFLPQIPVLLLYLGYYTTTEGWLGAGVGKALCGLRVVGPDRSVPGLRRAAIRAFWWFLPFFVVEVGLFVATSPAAYVHWRTSADGSQVGFGLSYTLLATILSAFLFITMRRGNGMAAVQDLASGTRAVVRKEKNLRPRMSAPPPATMPAGARRVGPYRVAESVAREGFVAGEDEVLQRPVWLRLHPGGAPPVSEARRAVQRPTRLRWLGGVRAAAEGWDAFEALPGQSLFAVRPGSQTWEAVRFWSLDLARELEAAARDGTLPGALSLGRVWLTPAGGAVLLDEPPAGSSAGEAFPDGPQLLHAVAQHALDPVTVSEQARDFLARLAAGRAGDVSALAATLGQLVDRPARISRRRRAAALLAIPATFLLIWYPGAFSQPDATTQPPVSVDFPAPNESAPAAPAQMHIPESYAIAARWLLPSLALVQLLGLLVFGETPGQRVWGFALVDARGRPPSRARSLGRWLVAWALVAVAAGLIAAHGGRLGEMSRLALAIVATLLLPWLAGVVATIARPARGPHDVLAGTYFIAR